MYIAVSRVYVGLLHESGRNVKHLELATGPRGVRGNERVLRPTQDSVDSDFLGGYVGNCGVLGDVAEIRDVGLNRKTLAQIFGSRLQDSVVAARARTGGEPQQHRAGYPHKSFEPETHPSLRCGRRA